MKPNTRKSEKYALHYQTSFSLWNTLRIDDIKQMILTCDKSGNSIKSDLERLKILNSSTM